MAEFGIGLATNVAGTIISVVIQKMKAIIQMEENLGDLKSDFNRLEVFLRHIEKQFQDQQKALPAPVQDCLERMHTALQDADDLIVRAITPPRCLGCCSLRNPKLSTQIRDWKPRFDRLFEELERVLSTCANAQQIASGAAPLAEVLRQPVQESGFVGSTIKSDQMKLQTWLGEAHPQARMIGVYGMGGVGKTSLLKLVYNHYKEVSGTFDVIIWLTVSKKYQIEELQASIAETLNLELEGSSYNDLRKMRLSDSLGNKKFLLILDDVWHSIDLIEEVGVNFGDHNCSKVLISSRSREVISAMEASEDYTLKIQPLSLAEGWELFRTRAFANGVVPDDIVATAREIASECQGLPLALKAVGAAMRRKKTADEWRRAFTLMASADPSFQASNSTIEKELYAKLKWSYEELPNRELKICFLYCAVFPEDAEIDVETLVEMWSAEKLVTRMDAGHEYIDVLVDTGLFEYVAAGDEIIKKKKVKIHDVLRDLAIYIGQSEEKWFFATGQQRQNFPSEGEIRDCKRISVGHNDIQDLPTDLICSELVSLVLANNRKITEVPERFLSTALPLKVLDLSGTLIRSLPTSLGRLEQLEFLRLTNCDRLEDLPESIGNLSHLRFLNLQNCESLGPLPDSIGKLRNLKHLNLGGCEKIGIPRGISSLTSLTKLFLHISDEKDWAVSVEDIANLSNLMELSATVKVEINESTMTTWTDLRRLEVCLAHDADGDEDIFPLNMENMKKLEDFILLNYGRVSLPNCISQFLNLSTLCLVCCPHLRELSACQIGNEIVGGGFPRLKTLDLTSLDRLESMVGSSVVSSEETMPVLEEITISDCSSLKRLGTKKLLRLKRLSIEDCSEFEALEIESAGLPMLENLKLEGLGKCQFIGGPSGVINDGVMPKLKVLDVHDCGLLKLGLEKLPNLRSISIRKCEKLREFEIGSGGFPNLRELPACQIGNEIVGGELDNLNRLESMVGSSVVSSEETMPVLEEITIRDCSSLKRLGTKKLLRLKRLSIEDCSEFEALEIESAGLPMLENLYLRDLRKCQFIVGASGVINDGVMPKLKVLDVHDCGLLGLETLPNLRRIFIGGCEKLRELKIGSGGFSVLETLNLYNCVNLENIVGSLDVWNDKTMPNLKSLMIANCPLLRRLPRGIDKLPNLNQITGNLKWWQELIWEDENVKMWWKLNLSRIFKERTMIIVDSTNNLFYFPETGGRKKYL